MPRPMLPTAIGLALLALVTMTGSGHARPAPPPLIQAEPPTEFQLRAGGAGLSHWGFQDTVLYGGTVWAADSMRWEAVRDSVWSFDTGVGSAFGPTGPNKPAGYHTLMEGWYGIDQSLNPLPWFRRSTTCAIAGSYSLWAGVTQSEADSLCYVSGRGYGNNWNITVQKIFAYPGSGSLTLSFDYAVDAEPGFDYAYVLLDSTGAGAAADQELAVYNGVMSGTATIPIPRGQLPAQAGPIAIKFNVQSDGGYSDEDGANPTTCGHSAFDNIQLTGAITDFSNFESGMNGWQLVVPVTGVGDFSNLADVADLPPPVTFCPCGLADSVLVFFDTTGHDPLDQDNIAASPWIDLKRHGDVGRPGKVLIFNVYRELPVANYVFEQYRVRYYPYVCPINGRIGMSPWKDPNFIVWDSDVPGCNSPSSPRIRDFSAVFGPGVEQAQIAFGIVNLCRTAPFGVACTGVTNTTPWFDDIALGLYGFGPAPNIQTTTFDRFQDNFATDGTLNPASPGRLDVNRIKNMSTPSTGAILGDTLTARGDGGNTEVRLVFRVRPGPFTSQLSYAIRSSRWTPEPVIGPNWYSARMDTAEQGGNRSNAIWMSTFHESDPGFNSNDRLPDPTDPSQLENEILPDNLFTPGTHIDYFVTSRYLPPDPRNPGGVNWYTDPDTTGGHYREVEILPSSMAADTTWNCVLYVDHHDDRNFYEQRVEEQSLTGALGSGGANFEGTRYDRFDNQTPSSGQLSWGRWLGGYAGASLDQALGYRTIVWHSSSLSSGQLTNEDAGVLRPWLIASTVGNRFWGTGDGLATSMHNTGTGTLARSFLNGVLGATRTCDTIRNASCPTGTPLDSTYCIPINLAAGALFPPSLPLGARGNGCPDLKSFDLLGVNAGVPTAAGSLSYQKSGAARDYASVANAHDDGISEYRTVLDGFGLGSARSQAGVPNVESTCRNTAAALARAGDVLSWFGSGSGDPCRWTPDISGVPLPGETPTWRARLGPITPNPTSGAARVMLTVPTGATSVRLSLFDVTGRLVRRLAVGPLTEGPNTVTWDGADDSGRLVSPGIYFMRYDAGRVSESRKIIVVR